MKLHLVLLLLPCLCASSAESASAFRFFNPFYWFTSSANRAPIHTPAASQGLGNASSLANTGQNSSQSTNTSVSQSSTHQEESTLVATPLRMFSVEVHSDSDIRGNGVVQVQVPTQVASSPASSSALDGVRRFGLIREKETQESREEIELQTTTVSGLSELAAAKQETNREKDPEPTTDRPKVARNEAASASQAETSAFPEPTTAAPSDLSQAKNESDEIATATTIPALETTTAAATKSTPALGTTSLSPVFVAPGAQKKSTFLYDDDFVRYLNRHYYEEPVFDGLRAGRALR